MEQGEGHRAQGTGHRAQGTGHRAQGTGHTLEHFNSKRLKRLAKFQFISCVVLAALLLAGCGDDDENNNNNNNGNKTEHIRIGSILLDKSTLELEVGEESKLQATIAPDNATHKEIRWKSDDERVATVDDNGLVRAVSKGKAVIHVVSADGSKTATCIVTVTQPVEGVSLEKCPSTMVVGSKEQLRASVEPREANNQALTWTSSNSNVATVDSSGLVSALAAGEVTIVVRSQENVEKTKSCTMTVVVPVGGIRIEGCETASMAPGRERTLTAIIEPNNATNEGVTWTSDDTDVATVDEDGVVTAVSSGKAVIFATTEDGAKTATCVVIVAVPAERVTMGGCSTTTLTPTQTRQLAVTVFPANATNKNVTWKSDNTHVATVDSNGLVTAGNPPLGQTTATITATTQDGNHEATCVVTVNVPTTAVAISGCSTAVLTPGQTRQLTATFSPTNATSRTVTWTSSNTNVATVNANGLVTAGNPPLGQTSTTLTATLTSNTSIKATCVVTVNVPPNSVSISGCPPEIPPGQSRSLSATVLPSNATNKAVTWSSSNTAVATVSSTGELWLRRSGTATITVRTNDSGRTATCNVRAQHIIERVCQRFGLPQIYIYGRGFYEVSQVQLDGRDAHYNVISPTEIWFYAPSGTQFFGTMITRVFVTGGVYYWYTTSPGIPYC